MPWSSLSSTAYAAELYDLGMITEARQIISVRTPLMLRPGPRSAPSRRGVRDPLRPVMQSQAVAGEQVKQMYARDEEV